MHRHLVGGGIFCVKENISETLQGFSEPEKSDAPSGTADQGCTYIAADSWPPGAPPYCGAPRTAGSSYCATHKCLCIAPPASRAGRRIALEQALAGRRPAPDGVALAVPERADEVQRIDRWDLPRRHRNTRNEENA